MATQSLVLCTDADVLGILRETLGELGIEAEVCDTRDIALDAVDRRRFDPIIIDCDTIDAEGEVLRRVRASAANRDAIALGIVRDGSQTRDIYSSGANFIVCKPVTHEEAGRVLRTARSLVSRMRRHFLRCVLDTLAYVRVDGLDEKPMMLDISEGGLAIQALEPLEARRAFAVHFGLPGENEEFEAVATAVWSDPSGRCGLRFLGMPPVHRQRLRQWLEGNGADGPGESPIDISLPAGGPRVHFPMRVSPAIHLLATICVDLAIVGAAVAVFVAITYFAAGSIPLAGKADAGLLLFCLGWLMYRYVFFGSLAMTPGGHAAAGACDRLLAWYYNKTVVSS
ncbi:MAG: PilZ domain-containing protein [Terriglobales bacterium]